MSVDELITHTACGVTFHMVCCPAGGFLMGSEEGEGLSQERPRRRVEHTRPFLIGQTLITQALWRAVTGESPSEFIGDQHPVERVSWCDVASFCNQLSLIEGLTPVYQIEEGAEPHTLYIRSTLSANGYRMPTEAEWAYAAKAGAELRYAGSDHIDEVAWYQDNSEQRTHPVAQKRANAWGIYDMSGHVWTWCHDVWNPRAYQDGSLHQTHTLAPLLSPRPLRGGSWNDGPYFCRIACRNWDFSDAHVNSVGARLARSIYRCQAA